MSPNKLNNFCRNKTGVVPWVTATWKQVALYFYNEVAGTNLAKHPQHYEKIEIKLFKERS